MTSATATMKFFLTRNDGIVVVVDRRDGWAWWTLERVGFVGRLMRLMYVHTTSRSVMQIAVRGIADSWRGLSTHVAGPFHADCMCRGPGPAPRNSNPSSNLAGYR